MARRIRAVGIDFDGTLSDNARPSSDVLASLREARAEGRRLLLVTGRILAELASVFPDAREFFDTIVAENGAVLDRHGGRRRLVAPIPFELDEALIQRRVRFRRGHVLLASTAPFASVILEEISRLGLDCQIVRNRGEIMVVPSGVTKGTGLVAALAELGVSPHDAAALGDAENDHTLLDACELGVAVANAVPSLKAHADIVLEEPNGRGVAGFLRGRVLRGEQTIESRRWRIEIGLASDGSPVLIPASAVNVLVEGKPLSGKSYAAGLFAEGLLELGYSVCVLDPEGDHRGLGGLHGCMLVGGHEPLPSPEQLADLFQPTFGSVVVDLSLLPRRERVAAAVSFLEALGRQRDETGFPHWIVVDEAHLALGDDGPACADFRPEQKGFCLVTYQPDHLCAPARDALDVIVTTEEDGRARLWRVGEPDDGVTFTLARRATSHVRHRHKYVHAELPTDHRFYFGDPTEPLGASAGNLQQFHHELRACSPLVLRHHLNRNDFSRWVQDVMQDAEFAQRLRAIEEEAQNSSAAGLTEQLRAEILDEVERRYLG
jgi:hypothetical protein